MMSRVHNKPTSEVFTDCENESVLLKSLLLTKTIHVGLVHPLGE